MGILDRLFGRPRKGSRIDYIRYSPAAASVLGLSPEQLYEKQPALRAVVDFLARNIAQLPIKVYELDGPDRRRSRDSTAALLLSDPAPGLTPYALKERTVIDLKLRGWALWYVTEDVATPSGWSIHPIPAAWIERVETEDGFNPSSYIVRSPLIGSEVVELDAADCIRFAGYNPQSPASNSSPVEALRDVLAEQINAWTFRNQVWANGGRVQSYLYRPAGVPWSEEAFNRFEKQWSEYQGNGGALSGRSPILEDGMELRTAQFNAHEADWAEATRLSRQDVAGVYHVSPTMVWHESTMTYASARDESRRLYADTLAPDLQMLADGINRGLLPMLGERPGLYAEFDLQAKLNGAFEDQAAQLTSAVGTPYMTPAEARQRLNLPYIEGTDVLARPLNIAYTDEVESPLEDATEDGKGALSLSKAASEPERKARGTASTEDVQAVSRALRRFYRRQRKAVLSKLDNPKMRASKAGDEWPAWWEGERWNRELTDDLFPVFLELAAADVIASMRRLGFDPSDFDDATIRGYIRKMAEARAKAVNDTTYRELLKALEGDISEDAEGATPAGVFDKAEDERGDMQARSFATALAGFGAMEAARQKAPDKKRTKTWIVTSLNPRSSHAAMNGETVDYDEPFSNGAKFPGDWILPASESCNCCCEVEVRIK